jgi:hypothetical protein
MHVTDDLAATEAHGAAHDPPLDRNTVWNQGIATLRDEPETAVLEHEDGWKDTARCLVEGTGRSGNRLPRLIVLACGFDRLTNRGREQSALDGRRDASKPGGTLHGT